MEFDPAGPAFVGRGLRLGGLSPLLDGEVPAHGPARVEAGRIVWPLDAGGSAILDIGGNDELRLDFRIEGVPTDRPVLSLGLRFAEVDGVRQYLRNGYHSWDGSFFVEPGTPAGDGPPGKAPTLGFAMTALLPAGAPGAVVIGFARHDRFQSRFRYAGTPERLAFDVETLIDLVPHDRTIAAETLLLFDGEEVEPSLRRWSRAVAAAAALAPRVPERRITGWCSWYSLYASIDEAVLREHLADAARFRDAHEVSLDIFQIDDGFTPEMGDWLDFKPQFPDGVAPLIAEIAAAGFTPGLWIAPFMVGNRSKLFAAHPDWVVRDRLTGGPLAEMKFYGEFRWHKRSEEYYILDVTHPDAAAYIGHVFATWRSWGVGYFKADFLLFGSEHGPDRARWHEAGLSRIAIWRRMLAILRASVGDALVLGSGCPLWASVGLVDAVRIGRDVGARWSGEQSAESLLRDQLTRNHAANILWQADPDCVLLRERFHELSDAQVHSLATFAGLAGGVLMTSDKLDELPPDRAALFAGLLAAGYAGCDFPGLGTAQPVIEQRARRGSAVLINRFNTGAAPADSPGGTLPGFASRLD